MVETPLRNKVNIHGESKGLGYLRDLQSIHDYTIQNVYSLTDKLKVDKPTAKKEVDLRHDMSPIRDQGDLGSCTSFAASGLVEYFEKKIHKKYTQMSTLFTYKATRNLMRVVGDTGAYMRSVMGSLALFGSPPEEFYPYNIRDYDNEPPAFTYAFGSNYQSLKYVRLDHLGALPQNTLRLIKQFIAHEYPVMFGFTVFDNIDQATETGLIPYPTVINRVVGGHAMVICGYNDENEEFIIRNSWGDLWGVDGYGYLPYKYFLNGLADDVWTIVTQEFIDHLAFQ